MSFTMPTLPGITRDLNVLPKRPGYDYAGRAAEAWQEIQRDLEALQQESDALLRANLRIQDGERWMHGNTEHPNYMDAYQFANELRNEVRNISINIRSLERVIWSNCLVVYGCLYHLDRQQWQQQHGVEWDASSPSAIWEAICPRRQQPGEYPTQKREAWLDRKINYAAWSLQTDG